MTPAQRHREDTFRRAADRDGLHEPECHFAAEGGCRGRLQAAHIISAQRLKTLYGMALMRTQYRGHTLPITDVELDDLLADGRNGVPACERHHHLREGPVLHCQAPGAFYEFVADYGLEHVVDNARSAA